ncbi:hypothetical protein QFC24_005554 [Naganishia onofrii]|uniref:Uncharacterized protein n=1 Tax=Naganishia onofrii TaxID=1851511 RepID=A0ACC2X8D0_9TREE|nr:hypothetical protein QFC24_005554 [Naganishia onofrii]
MFGMTPVEAGSSAEHIANVPPWELLHLSTAGLNLDMIPVADVLPIDEKRAALSHWPSLPVFDDMSNPDDMSRIDRIRTASTAVSTSVSSSNSRNDSHDSQPKPGRTVIDEKSEDFVDVPILLVNDERPPSSLSEPDEPPSPLQLDQNLCSAVNPTPFPQCGMAIKNKSNVTFDTGECAKEGAAAEPEPVMQTMRDFFQAHRATDTEVMHAHKGADIGPEESAAEYSNRQASLLMLYFPIAYLFVFSVSLVRLMHDMITSKPSSALTIISLWFVLSAGLLDALVYVRLCGTFDQANVPYSDPFDPLVVVF